MPAPADFRLYSSNALDVLAALLAEELRVAPAGAGILDPDTILIPQVSMRRWLQKTLAERHGIAANLRFLAPGEFVGELLAANLGDAEDTGTLDPARLQWRLYAALRDPALLAEPAFDGALRGYLGAAGADLNAWSLAHELADVYAKYQAWRRDWLLRWDAGGDLADWQAALWRTAIRGLRHRAQAIDRFLDRHARDDAPPPRGLPARVFAFACINVSPDVLRVLATAARATTLHFYLPTPTRKYWGDLPLQRERLRAGNDDAFDRGENPLLAAWGRAGRDFVATLFAYEIVAPREIEAYAPPDPGAGLLQLIKADVLDRRAPTARARAVASIATDRSLQVHACHTRLREVQVLHDQLRALLEERPHLEPRDIAVMAPDIDAYAPYVAAVFGGAQGSARFIPYTLADGSAEALSPLAESFLRLLDLPQSRLTGNDVLDLLALPALQRRLGLDDDALARIRGWVGAAGVRWGLDAAHRARLGAPAEHAYTWRFALDRLLLGFASGSDDDIAGVAPWPQLEGGDALALDALVRLLDRLERAMRDLAREHTAADWQRLLATLLDDLLPASPANPLEQRALDRLRTELDALRVNAADAGPARTLAPEVVRAHLRDRLAQADPRQPFLAGGVSFCRMVPMRLIPFRAICLLGLNDGDYPRREPPSSLNRLAAALHTPSRRRGDRSVREDDRFLFLQLMTAADDVFYLSYIGHDATDGLPREPSVLISELLDVAASTFDDPSAARDALVVQHALQPFAANADGDARSAGFDPAWHAARTARVGAQSPPAFAGRALPLSPMRAAVDHAQLRAFLLHPPRAFLRNRLGLRVADAGTRLAEDEPFVAADALANDRLRRRVLDALSAGALDAARLRERLEAEALIAPAAAGAQQVRDLVAELRPLARAIAQARAGHATARAFALDLDGIAFGGAVDGVDDASAIRFKPGAPRGRDWLRWHLDALVLAACGDERAVVAFAEFDARDLGPRPLAKPEPAAARAALSWLIALMQHGLDAPLPVLPGSAWAWTERRAGEDADVGAAVAAAALVWRGHDGHGEGSDEWTRIALGERDPFVDVSTVAEFATLAEAVVAVVRDARVDDAAIDLLRTLERRERTGAPS